MRGGRYTIGHAGAAPVSEMPVLTKKIADLGWHVQLHVMNDGGGASLAEMPGLLASLPTPVGIDRH